MCTVLLPPGGYPIAVDKYIKLASATEVPHNRDDKPLFPSKGRHRTRKTAELSISGLRCGCDLWRGSNRA
jgi:hypothetical protein